MIIIVANLVMSIRSFLSLILILSGFACSNLNAQTSGLNYYKVISDTLFESSQRAFIVAIQKEKFDEFSIDVVYDDHLVTTSEFGDANLALAAINGGFFDMKEGFSVSFLEKWNRQISPTRNTNPMLNGAFIVEKEGDVKIEEALPDSLYLSSRDELSVIGTGPLLLKNGKKSEIGDAKFSTNRHPRSCICESDQEIMFVVVDGRSSKAEGMSLFELQNFLLTLQCKDAVNLDGGGSSSLWIRGKGVVNTPSDRTGERPIANAIVIRPN